MNAARARLGHLDGTAFERLWDESGLDQDTLLAEFHAAGIFLDDEVPPLPVSPVRRYANLALANLGGPAAWRRS
jgi:hypothetical protein